MFMMLLLNGLVVFQMLSLGRIAKVAKEEESLEGHNANMLRAIGCALAFIAWNVLQVGIVLNNAVMLMEQVKK